MIRTRDFHPTDHFLYRQWDRGVEDSTVNAIIRYATPGSKEQTIIAFPWFLRNHGEKTDNCLVIIFKEKNIVTTYWRPMERILFNSFHAINIKTLIK